MIVQMAVSRTREYAADRRGAEICGNPLWLSTALNKIARSAKVIPNEEAEHNPATAHMFIINPLSGRGADSLFDPSRHGQPHRGTRTACRRNGHPLRRCGIARICPFPKQWAMG